MSAGTFRSKNEEIKPLVTNTYTKPHCLQGTFLTDKPCYSIDFSSCFKGKILRITVVVCFMGTQ